MRLDTENDGGIEIVSGADSVDALITDMKEDPRIDDSERCMIVAEMGKWMFALRIHAQIQAATGCGL